MGEPLTEDVGLFGPESVTWRVHVEPVLWIGGFRALLLQSLHPQVMRGTHQNSALFDQSQAWARFQRTVEFVGVRTFATTPEVDEAARRVRRIHATLFGYDPDSGDQFRLNRPEYLLWVHCAEIDSYVDIAHRSGVLTTDEQVDAYIDESRRAAEIVGIPTSMAPRSRAELDTYFDGVRPQLYACPEAMQALRRSFNPSVPLLWSPLKLAAPPLSTLAFATLPSWARRLYGAFGLGLTNAAATTAVRTLHYTTGWLPELPAPDYVSRARSLIRDRDIPSVPAGEAPSARGD